MKKLFLMATLCGLSSLALAQAQRNQTHSSLIPLGGQFQMLDEAGGVIGAVGEAGLVEMNPGTRLSDVSSVRVLQSGDGANNYYLNVEDGQVSVDWFGSVGHKASLNLPLLSKVEYLSNSGRHSVFNLGRE